MFGVVWFSIHRIHSIHSIQYPVSSIHSVSIQYPVSIHSVSSSIQYSVSSIRSVSTHRQNVCKYHNHRYHTSNPGSCWTPRDLVNMGSNIFLMSNVSPPTPRKNHTQWHKLQKHPLPQTLYRGEHLLPLHHYTANPSRFFIVASSYTTRPVCRKREGLASTHSFKQKFRARSLLVKHCRSCRRESHAGAYPIET